MAVHDWTRVSAGIFHDFHNTWIVTLKNALNDGLLPSGYYAIFEQRAGQIVPDVLITLEETREPSAGLRYALKQRTLVIRQSSNHRIVALVEIVSPGNKDRPSAVRAFVEKAIAALKQGYHLLVVDLHAPGRHDPQGIHGAIWIEFTGDTQEPPADKSLTLASYVAAVNPKAYVEPVTIGAVLLDMPLFLDPEYYVNAPLEGTYQSAYQGVPSVWRRVIEGTGG